MINNTLTNWKRDTKNRPKDNANKIEENNKIIHIVEHILYFNKENQEGSSLKILAPNQMLSRLPISLAQSNAGNNEIRQFLYSLYISKKTFKKYL